MFTVHFSVTLPLQTHDWQYVFVTGSHEQLGNWNVDRALKLKKSNTGYN